MKIRSSGRMLAVTVLLLVPQAVLATTVTIQPSSQDAYVNRSQPNAVHGSAPTATRMFVMSSSPNPRWERGLVQFDLPIPAFSTVTSAILQINEQSGNLPNSRTHGAHRITASWLQSTVKWNTQPAANASATATAVVGTSRGFKSFDVTADVQAMVNGPGTNHGWMIMDENELVGNDEVGYVTREDMTVGDIGNRPILTVTFTGPACVQDSDCADTNPCTANEHCFQGQCAVDAATCDDGNACTDDICDPQQGCLHPIGECNDGFTCTTDSCDTQLGCVHTPVPSVCAHNGCQTGTCVADQNDTGLDPVTGCEVASVAPDGTGCDLDASACTADTCASGECTAGSPTTCTPLDQCHDAGTCNPGTGLCSNPAKPDNSSCADGNACTQTDTCQGGTCTGANPVVCTALDQCHDAGTCDTGSGLCSNPAKPDNSPCADGDACTQTDTCQGGTCTGGNPVVCTALDQCHVAGTCDTQTGLCSNPNASDGIGCDDGNVCTLADACSGGQCVGNPQTCGDGIVQPSCNEECDDQTPGANCTAQCRFICGPTPQADCRKPTIANKAVLVLKNKTPDKRDALVWRWVKGAETTLADFGTPLTTTAYTLCVYDASANPQPLLLSMAPAGGTCAGKPCWKTVSSGLKYKDSELTPDGLSFMLEKAGVDGAAKVIVKGKGVNLAVPTLPLTPTVTVQLKRNDDPAICWDATFSAPTKNLPEQFNSKAD